VDDLVTQTNNAAYRAPHRHGLRSASETAFIAAADHCWSSVTGWMAGIADGLTWVLPPGTLAGVTEAYGSPWSRAKMLSPMLRRRQPRRRHR
jgi:hypothetical protein